MSVLRMSGLISGIDTDSVVKELMSAQRLKNKKVSDKLQLSQWKEDKWKELNTKLYKLYTDSLSDLRLQGSYKSKTVSTSNDSAVSVTAGSSAVTGSSTLEVNQLASAQYVTSGVVTTDGTTKATSSTKLSDLQNYSGDDISFVVSGNTYNLSDYASADGATVGDVVTMAKAAGLNASFDETQGRFFFSSKSSGSSNSFQITGSDLADLGLDALKADGSKVDTSSTTSSVVQAADSKIVYNGAVLTGSSNTVTVNGLTLNLKETTTSGEKITLSVSNNVDANYDKVKDFIKSYNDILQEMNDLYYADSAKGYEPLSDDEKEAMTDDQIEKWETKIQDSILRRDTTLGSVIESVKTAMMSSYTDSDGKKYSLSTFGIMTSSDYTEKGLLHIYGDSDDSTYETMDDKLKTAFTNDPDSTIEALSGIFKNLYDTMSDKMKSIPNVSSAYTFYNDKLLDKEQTDYSKQVATLESKLSDMEDKYYKQFSAMETALAKLQSQSSALAGLMGGSTSQ